MAERRLDTRGRARALQLLYAWELTGGGALDQALTGVARLIRPMPTVLDLAEAHAARVIANVGVLDRRAAAAAENWRWDRVAVIERNILRLAIQELEDGQTPPKVVIDEAVRLAHWFAGGRASAFINGVLDRVARDLGRLA
ncbi:MAG TPA: transcription antitermination factor NusB [Gemmatimonadales bacterium]|jgi:N utilization substance protein B|nr:transcription antitermination factor NusB [Gemmatimonadales bacterium]